MPSFSLKAGTITDTGWMTGGPQLQSGLRRCRACRVARSNKKAVRAMVSNPTTRKRPASAQTIHSEMRMAHTSASPRMTSARVAGGFVATGGCVVTWVPAVPSSASRVCWAIRRFRPSVIVVNR